MTSHAIGRATLLVACGAIVGVVAAQPGPGVGSDNEMGYAGSGSGSETAQRAGSSSVESNDVPVWRASPARFAVTPFENHTNMAALDWIVDGAPFEIAEKSEQILSLEPTGAESWYVGPAMVPPDPGPVADFAKAQRADYVITGWYDRVGNDLRLAILVWKGNAVAGQSLKSGPPGEYHRVLGEALAEAWRKAKVPVDDTQAARMQRQLAIGPPKDTYAMSLLGRGILHLNTALTITIPAPAPRNATPAEATAADRAINTAQIARGKEFAGAQHDLERAVFIDPKCYEAQRLIGELYVILAKQPGADTVPAVLRARAAGKFNYAVDLAPDDIASLRSAAAVTAAANKHELAVEMYRKLVTYKPWNLDARYELGAALWRTGDPGSAEKQLEQVTAHAPDHLPARRVLALIHASRNNTKALVAELEAIAQRAPDDLEVKGDLATAYGALGQWDRATKELETIANVRTTDLALFVRVAEAHAKQKDLDGALAWYAKAGKLGAGDAASYPGYLAAQALYDAGKYADAIKAYTSLQKYRDDLPNAEQALGAIAIVQNRFDDAAWYLRRATKSNPRSLPTWVALAEAELGRKDVAQARRVIDRARETWARDPELRFLSGLAHAVAGEPTEARADLVAALAAQPSHAGARTALALIDSNTPVPLAFVPKLARPWGDADTYQRVLEEFEATKAQMAVMRASYQTQLLTMLGELGSGPLAKPTKPRTCPLSRMAPSWAIAKTSLESFERLGIDLERAQRFIARHDEIGATAGLMPSSRTQVAAAKRAYRIALADDNELRSEWTRMLGAELRVVGCTDKLLAAAAADPARYHLIEEDKDEVVPTPQAPRAKPRATFYVDNSECRDDVEVWIDGTPIGHVAPGKRNALVADGGERALCLIVAGNGTCGDRGTVRQVYLHDGWSVTLHCPK